MDPDARPTHLDQILDEVLLGGREQRAIVIVDYDPAWPLRFEHERDHRMFRTSNRDVHVHVWGDSDPEVASHLRFRDRLRESDQDRLAYERLIRDLVSREWPDMNYYAEAKAELIQAIIARAG